MGGWFSSDVLESMMSSMAPQRSLDYRNVASVKCQGNAIVKLKLR